MTMMVDKSNTVDGVPTSLLDLGYSDVGLDDVSRIVIAPYLLRCCPPPLPSPSRKISIGNSELATVRQIWS